LGRVGLEEAPSRGDQDRASRNTIFISCLPPLLQRCYSCTAKIGSLESILVVSFALILIVSLRLGEAWTQIVARSLPHNSLTAPDVGTICSCTHPIDLTDAGARLKHLSPCSRTHSLRFAKRTRPLKEEDVFLLNPDFERRRPFK
jgi:hypothetical protein